ncbi:cyclin K [Arctopsyche grandis]|uniref:cyclin K n=1 Tax=Arctopsyche grandis TaxID=121162 RepID=UPI00406D7FDD
MPSWYYDKSALLRSPSFLEGISAETESRYRKEGARFIIDTGTLMDLGYSTTATGVVYFHRFYMLHSFRTFPRYVTACCCLFLAGKVEETPKKCKDIIKQAKQLLSDSKFATFGADPKEEVMTLERILLQSIKFDLQVEHPYQYLLKYAKCLKGDKVKLQKMVQMAWTFVNDSLSTTLSLQWEPEIIAVALMFLAGKLSLFKIEDWSGRTPKHNAWWDMFLEDATTDLLEDICHQVLDLYTNTTTLVPESPPLLPLAAQTPKSEKKKSVSPPQSMSPVNPITTIKSINTPIKNNGIERMDTKPDLHVHPIKSIVSIDPARFQYPMNYGPPPPYAASFQANIPTLPTAPPPLLSLPTIRPPLGFSEPPPNHYPPSVPVPPHNYFPPPQSRSYYPPPT